MPDDDGEGGTRIALPDTEIYPGVKLGGDSNTYHCGPEEDQVEYTDPDDGPFPWGMLVWFVLAAMLACGIGAVVSGR